MRTLMATHPSCPQCKTLLMLPQPASDTIRCTNCGAILKAQAANSQTQEAVTAAVPPAALAAGAPPVQPSAAAPAPAASRVNVLVLAGLAAGLLLVCLLPIAGLTL